MMTAILLLSSLLASPRRQASDLRLKPEFYVVGELYVEFPFQIRSQHLLLRTPNGQILWIQDMRRLKGHVEIRSPGQALSFVRLWGSPLLAGAIGDWDLEIATKSEIDGLSFGDPRCKEVLEKSRTGMYGIANLKTMHSEGVRPATVKAVNGGFQISRYVLSVNFNENRYRILLMREFVKRNGAYFAKVVSSRPTSSAVWLQAGPL